MSPSPLQRLTQPEYENTIRDIFGSDALAAVTNTVGLADARANHEFSVLAQGVTSQHVLSYFEAASILSAHVTASRERLAALASCLGQTPLPDGCVRGFVEKLGRRIYRRPLAANEVSAQLETYKQGEELGVADGVRLVLFRFLQSPHFLYRVQIQGTEMAGSLRLTAYGLAARLSYLAWGSTPDERLLDAAANGQLDNETGLAAELDRVLGDPRARAWMERFFNEWLEVDPLPPITQSDAFMAGISRTGLANDMRKELTRFALFAALDQPNATFKDLMTSTVAFMPSANMAKVYGVPAPASPDERMTLAVGQRDGLLSRSALLMASEETTSPITRGALVRRKMLCSHMELPDPSLFPPNTITPPAFDPNKTARQRWTEKTNAPMCWGCHAQINPLGYALESYDTIGRVRSTEPIVDPKTNKVVNNLPIDVAVDAPLGDRTVRVNGAAGLASALAADKTAQACFAEQWLTFAYRRAATPGDACLLSELAETGAGRGLREMFRRSVLTPGFRLRRLEP